MQGVLKGELLTQAQAIRPGDHLVALYRDERDVMGYVTAFIQSSLAKNARCIYITGAMDTPELLSQWAELWTQGNKDGEFSLWTAQTSTPKTAPFHQIGW